jgi:hypothetical protein
LRIRQATMATMTIAATAIAASRPAAASMRL